ncbi:MAG: DUF4339 domain-containing protein [Verrucomicrobia bacterium]|jgi:hypothetical protein|nr:MAG: DUF4339 domain-containing protein [Verrucomicrobiota bacterium]
MAEYYYLESENQIGPVSKGDLRALLEKGAVTPQTPVFRTGDKEWQTAHYYRELAVDRKVVATPSPDRAKTDPKPVKGNPLEWISQERRPERAEIAWMVIIIGALIAGYFLFFYSTTVGTDSHTNVNNIGLMLNRLLGSIVGMVTIVVGVILLVTDTKKPSK